MTTFSNDGTVIQFDTITVSGTYDITAAGGQGGTGAGHAGGLAASSGGDIFLQAGAVLEIVVGGAGANAGEGGGGGGGSFVIEINNGSAAVDINEVIAGGGGGAGSGGVGGSGLAAPTGGNGSGAGAGAGGVNGAAGAGGSDGGGGGGFEGGNGSADGKASSGIAGGSDFAGGAEAASGGGGGFGGGGGGGTSGGGGGGGYGGGGGGGIFPGDGGGGGGSYVNPAATNITKTAGVQSGNGVVTIDLLCYCRGTRIQTARGEIAVEDLGIGDLVVTQSGAIPPIQWIGRRHIDLTRHPDPSRARPIRIAAGAFPGGVPHRDLLVSPDHAVVFDGMLIPARLLVNGASIAHDTVCRQATYFHVELASHDVLLAEGLPAESYLDTGNRATFDNAVPAFMLHPDFTTGQEGRVSRSCLPFADRPDQVEPVWRALVDRAEALGWVVPRPMLTDDPDLHLRVGARRIDPVAVRDNRYTFVLPPRDGQATLASRAARPSEARLWIADDRRLGVMVRRLVHRGTDGMREVSVDDPALEQGWWAIESDRLGPCRWTNGDAVLPLIGAGVLEVELFATMRYPAVHDTSAVPVRLAAA